MSTVIRLPQVARQCDPQTDLARLEQIAMTLKRKLNSKPKATKPTIRAEAFQVVTFHDEVLKRQVLMLYALGSDGVIREMRGTEWHPYPIT